jgi:hypothetical protein
LAQFANILPVRSIERPSGIQTLGSTRGVTVSIDLH